MVKNHKFSYYRRGLLLIASALIFTGCPALDGAGELPFVAVTRITGVPDTATAGQDLELTGTVEPAGATRRTILWSVKEQGDTGAEIVDGSILRTGAAGTVLIAATIAGGKADSEDYTDDFPITVRLGLAAAIGAAHAARTGVSVSVDGSDVPAESYWVSQEDLDTLNTAIDAAGEVPQTASQAEKTAAASALAEATDAFNLAKQKGTKATATKTALTEAIAAANAAKIGVTASADGSNVPESAYWAPQTAFDTLNDAIEAAETVSQDSAATQEAVNAAASALATATDVFNDAKRSGTATASDSTPDKETLTEAIAAANAAKSGVAAAADGSDVPKSGYWAPQAAFDALNDAIEAAETVSQDSAATQEEVNAAASALAAATDVFNDAKRSGTKPSLADKTALAAAIGTANATKIGVVASVNGSDVPMDLYWASQAAFDALATAIGAAEATAQDPAAEQAEVDAATSALTGAVNAFKTAARRGAKPVRTVSANGVSFDLRLVDPPGPGGFKYGSGTTSIATISKGYWMGETEVTQELFEAVMGVNPGYFKDPAAGETVARRPVESVNWYAAIAFCNKLSLLDGRTPVYSVSVGGREVDWVNLVYDDIPGPTSGFENREWNDAKKRDGNGYRLPYDMEWMWAAMGGAKGGDTVTSNGYAKPFAGSNGTNSMDDYAWHSGNAAVTTHEAGKKLPNELGLYDMTGNVAEWCGEQQGYTIFARHSAQEPAWIFRGGGWSYATTSYAVGNRGEDAHDHPSKRFTHVGFRIACDK
jgi:formylglycine-generating enzyme required for sulfatase activity